MSLELGDDLICHQVAHEDRCSTSLVFTRGLNAEFIIMAQAHKLRHCTRFLLFIFLGPEILDNFFTFQIIYYVFILRYYQQIPGI